MGAAVAIAAEPGPAPTLETDPLMVKRILTMREVGAGVTVERFRLALRAEAKADANHAEAMAAIAETNRLLGLLVEALGTPAKAPPAKKG